MKKIEYLQHTADIRVKVESDSLEGLFLAGLEAMNHVIGKSTPSPENTTEMRRTIELKAPDTTVLLIDFLSEILTLTHTTGVLFSALKVTKLTEKSMLAEVSGFPADHFEEDIKAVTYHEAEVVQNEKGNWQTVIIFDI
jgi:SHS2 domain-containing protein